MILFFRCSQTQNLLVKISHEGQYSSQYDDIVYNANKQPVTITYSDYYMGKFESSHIYNYEWTNDGLLISYSDAGRDFKTKILFNSQNQFIKSFESEKVLNSQVYDTSSITTYTWTNNKQVRVVCSYPHATGGWEETAEYGLGWSPFKGQNIAVEHSFGDLVDYQNTYLITKWHSTILDKEITYNFNDQNYPTKADIKYTSIEEGTHHEYLYFQYESY